MAELTLDAGVLIAADRNDRRVWALKIAAVRDGTALNVPAPALAQAWRGPRNANLARFLRGCRVVALDDRLARATGELCGAAGTSDIVDASVVLTAGPGGIVVTTDPGDLRPLAARGGGVTVRRL